MPARHFYEFGPYRLDVLTRRVLRGDEPLALTPKAFDTLLLLVRNRERTLDKQELMQALWPATAVEESNLTQQVFTVRRLLGEQPDGRPYIETLPKRGYHFAASVSETREDPPDAAVGPPARAIIGPLRVWLAPALGLAAGIGIYWFLGHPLRPPPERFQSIQISKVTHNGKSVAAAISPDGRRVAYVVDDTGQQSLWVTQVAIANHVQLVPPAEVRYHGLTFSPDGDWVYYLRGGSLHRVPVLGGASQPVLGDVDRPITFSPDGARFAFIREDLARGESELLLANADGGGLHKLGARVLPFHYRFAAWSPDGRWIACSAGGEDGRRSTTVTLVHPESGAERPLASRHWVAAGQLAWSGDGVVVAAQDGPFSGAQIWHVSYPTGEARPITHDLMDYRYASVASDGRKLATVQRSRMANVWIAADDDAARARPITSGAGQNVLAQWTPDGRIVYQSEASGKPDVWVMNADGSGGRRLTANACFNFSPAVSPDGRSIAYASDCGASASLWVMDIDGAHARPLTGEALVDSPSWSPDGRWIVYVSSRGGKPTLWKVATDAGNPPVPLTERLSRTPAVSPDGRRIAIYYWNERPPSPVQIAVIPFEGGSPSQAFDLPETAAPGPIRWTPDGRALAYVADRGGFSSIWRQPLDGGPARPIARFQSDRIFSFDWSRDGRQMTLSRGVTLQDVVLIEDATTNR